ncbi:MAG: radical SAM protein [Phycisphaerales bacterium]|nr:radical SAM protein [Phycisphaerales bacterium]
MGIMHRVLRRRVAVWQTEIRLLHRFGGVRPPEAVQWISTATCDLHCPHCYSHAGRRGREELDFDEVARHIIDELVRLGRPRFVIAGGEALLRPDFARLVRLLHRRRIPWALHTHGGRVDRLLDVFRRHPPVMVAISLDGPREVHDAFRGRAGSFDDALRAMHLLKSVGVPEVIAGTTITRANADRLVDLVPVVLDSGADAWGFHLVTPEGRAGGHPELLPTAGQVRRAAALARRLRAIMRVELDNEWGSAGAEDAFYRDDPFLCGAGRLSCVIAANGDVMPCTTTDPAERAGNVRTERLADLWARGFGAFRTGDDARRADPHDCWLQTRHGRSCRRAAFLTDVHDDLSLTGAIVPLTIGACP